MPMMDHQTIDPDFNAFYQAPFFAHAKCDHFAVRCYLLCQAPSWKGFDSGDREVQGDPGKSFQFTHIDFLSLDEYFLPLDD